MERILFFDDDRMNTDYAEMEGVLSVHCPKAFDVEEWDEALQLLESRKGKAAASGKGAGMAAEEAADVEEDETKGAAGGGGAGGVGEDAAGEEEDPAPVDGGGGSAAMDTST